MQFLHLPIRFTLLLLMVSFVGWSIMLPCANSQYLISSNGGTYLASGCQFANQLTAITDTSLRIAPVNFRFEGGSVRDAAGLLVYFKSMSNSSINLTIRDFVFGKSAVLKVNGTIPVKSTIEILNNTFSLANTNPLFGLKDQYLAIILGDFATPLMLTESQFIVCNNIASKSAVQPLHEVMFIRVDYTSISLAAGSRFAINGNVFGNTAIGNDIVLVYWRVSQVNVATASMLSISHNTLCNVSVDIASSNNAIAIFVIKAIFDSLFLNVFNGSRVDISSNALQNVAGAVGKSTKRTDIQALSFTGESMYLTLDSNAFLSTSDNSVKNAYNPLSDTAAVSVTISSLVVRVSNYSLLLVLRNTIRNSTFQNTVSVILMTTESINLDISTYSGLTVGRNELSFVTSNNQTASNATALMLSVLFPLFINVGDQSSVRISDNSLTAIKANKALAVFISSHVFTVFARESLLELSQNIIAETSVSFEANAISISAQAAMTIGIVGNASIKLENNKVSNTTDLQQARCIHIAAGLILELRVHISSILSISGNQLYNTSAQTLLIGAEILSILQLTIVATAGSSLIMSSNGIRSCKTLANSLAILSMFSQTTYMAIDIHNSSWKIINSDISDSTSTKTVGIFLATASKILLMDHSVFEISAIRLRNVSCESIDVALMQFTEQMLFTIQSSKVIVSDISVLSSSAVSHIVLVSFVGASIVADDSEVVIERHSLFDSVVALKQVNILSLINSGVDFTNSTFRFQKHTLESRSSIACLFGLALAKILLFSFSNFSVSSNVLIVAPGFFGSNIVTLMNTSNGSGMSFSHGNFDINNNSLSLSPYTMVDTVLLACPSLILNNSALSVTSNIASSTTQIRPLKSSSLLNLNNLIMFSNATITIEHNNIAYGVTQMFIISSTVTLIPGSSLSACWNSIAGHAINEPASNLASAALIDIVSPAICDPMTTITETTSHPYTFTGPQTHSADTVKSGTSNLYVSKSGTMSMTGALSKSETGSLSASPNDDEETRSISHTITSSRNVLSQSSTTTCAVSNITRSRSLAIKAEGSEQEVKVVIPIPVPAPTTISLTVISSLLGGTVAAVDAQTIALIGLVACSGQRREADSNLRSLSIAALDNTCEGVLLGNTLIIVAAAFLTMVSAAGARLLLVSRVRKGERSAPTLMNSCAMTRAPQGLVLVSVYCMNSFSVCGLQVARDSSSSLTLQAAGWIAFVFALLLVVGFPVTTFLIGSRSLVSVTYHWKPRLFQYIGGFVFPAWHLSDGIPHHKLFGCIFSGYRRLHSGWSLVSHMSFLANLPMIIASNESCRPMFILSAVLHLVGVAILLLTWPRRVHMSDVFHCATLTVNGLIVVFATRLLADGGNNASHDALDALGTAITVLTVLRIIHSVTLLLIGLLTSRGVISGVSVRVPETVMNYEKCWLNRCLEISAFDYTGYLWRHTPASSRSTEDKQSLLLTVDEGSSGEILLDAIFEPNVGARIDAHHVSEPPAAAAVATRNSKKFNHSASTKTNSQHFELFETDSSSNLFLSEDDLFRREVARDCVKREIKEMQK